MKQLLLPCPFCGGIPDTKSTWDGEEMVCWVECTGCWATTADYTEGADESAQAWNTRTVTMRRHARVHVETLEYIGAAFLVWRELLHRRVTVKFDPPIVTFSPPWTVTSEEGKEYGP